MSTSKRYETPEAMKNDAQTLAADAGALLEATSSIADEKVREARERLQTALEGTREFLGEAKNKARAGAVAADQCIRQHPYESIAVAFGVGAVLGYLITRRD